MKKLALTLLALPLILGLAATPSTAARSGGTLNFMAPYGSNVSSLDPHPSYDEQVWLITLNIHRGLYKWNAQKGEPQLELAENVSISDDLKTYTYQLRKNIKFHNGRKLTADDVIWSYERIMNPKNAFPASRFVRIIKGAEDVETGKAETISGLRKIDDYTLEITLTDPVDPGFYFWNPGTAILPREEIEKPDANFGANPVGCGPFMFVNWVKGSEVVLKKFPDFYEPGKPYLDKLVYKIMGESAARDIAFRARELDATIVGQAQYPAYKSDPVISKNMVEVAEMFTRVISFNRDYTLPDGRKPFADKRVRQAINHAIDSKLIIKKFVNDKAFPCVGYLPNSSAAFDPNAKGYAYDPQKAKALLKAAGYEKGFTFEVTCTKSQSHGVGIAEVVIPFLNKVGVTMKPLVIEGATKFERQLNGDFQSIMASHDSGPDPLQAMRRFHSSMPRNSGNSPAYNNPDYDKLIDEAGQYVNDRDKMLVILKKADALLTDDAPMWLFNYNKGVIAHHPWVHGIQPVAPEMMYQDMTDLWIDETSPRADKN